MDQSNTNNSTKETPQDFRLRRTHNGWSGKNENFRVVDNVIKIKYSDADPAIAPTEQQRRKMYDASGNYSHHKLLAQGDYVFQLWMSKIGPYLADWVLDKRNDSTALRVPWKLIGFPEGYTLWVHLTGDHSDPANPRTDAYLYGSPHKIFRSPMEFVEHAIWLMNGGVSQCLCKYCTPGQSQRAINRRLNHGDEDADADDDSDGGAPTAAAPRATIADLNAMRHPLFRNRGGAGATVAAATSANKRRARERESASSIKAKDYRVGNSDNGAGGAGGMAA